MLTEHINKKHPELVFVNIIQIYYIFIRLLKKQIIRVYMSSKNILYYLQLI